MKYFALFITVLFFAGFATPSTAQDEDQLNHWTTVIGEKSIDIMVSEEYSNRLFVVRCEKKKTYAFIVWDEFVGTTPKVEYKTDQLPPKEQYWKSGTNGGSSFFPSRTIEFLKKMEGSRDLSVKVTPIGKAPLTATFNIAGIEQVLAPIREACKWR